MTNLPNETIMLLSTLTIVIAKYFYLFFQEKEKYFLIWAIGWILYFTRYYLEGLTSVYGSSLLYLILYNVAHLLGSYLIVRGFLNFLGKRVNRFWVTVTITTTLFLLVVGVISNHEPRLITYPVFVGAGISFIFLGLIILKSLHNLNSRYILAGAFSLWGTHKLLFILAASEHIYVGWRNHLSTFLVLAVALGQLLAHFEKSRNELRASEEKLNALVEASPLAIITLDKEARVLSWNSAAEKMFGWKAVEVIGRPYSVVPENKMQAFEKYFNRVCRDGVKLVGLDATRLRRDGSPMHVSISAAPMYGPHGQIEGPMALIQDMTEKYSALKALKENEQKLSLLYQKANDMIALTAYRGEGLPGNYIDVNEAATRILGYSREEFLKMKPYDIEEWDEYSRKNVPAFLEQCETEGSSTFETIKIAKGGERIPMEVQAHLIKINGQKVFFFIARDIRNRKQAEEALNEANEKLKAIIDSSPQAIIVFGHDKVVRGWNKSAEQLFQWKADEVLGEVYPLVPKGKEEESERLSAQALKGNRTINIETQRQRKDGSLLEVEVTAVPLHDKVGKVMGVMVLLEDITERKKTEVAITEARKQAGQFLKMASMGAMTAAIAHELNQPLNSLKVIADSIIYWHEKGKVMDQDNVVSKLRKISAQVDRITHIINHMRSIIGREQGKELEICDINEAVRSAIRMLTNFLTFPQITLSTDLSAKLPSVRGRKGAIEEVVVNLLANSFQALKGVTKQDKLITINTRLEGSHILLEVCDNAVGIPPENLEKIFAPFVTTKPGQGMGLGLFVAHSIVTNINGSIEAINNKQGGATFRVRLPVST